MLSVRGTQKSSWWNTAILSVHTARRLSPSFGRCGKRCQNSLLFAYRHFPLAEAHPHALHAAEASEAAGAQGKFWEMHDCLFEHQDALEDEDLIDYAAEVGCNLDQFVNDMAENRYAARVREDFLSGVRSGVNGTPTIFINGLRYDGPRDLESMLAAIEQITALRA